MTDKESLTGIEQEVQIEERTRHAMETYVNWLQNAMSASPWTNVSLNKKATGKRQVFSSRSTTAILCDLSALPKS
jgi:hypothetical protein